MDKSADDNKKVDDRGQIRSFIKAEMQRNKINKKKRPRDNNSRHQVQYDDDDDDHAAESKTKYRDRAKERRQGNDNDSTESMHKGLDYSLLQKVQKPSLTHEKGDHHNISTTNDTEAAAVAHFLDFGMVRTIAGRPEIARSKIRNTLFEYDLRNIYQLRPLTIVKSTTTPHDNSSRIPEALITLVSQAQSTTRHPPRPEFNKDDDIFADAGIYTKNPLSMPPQIPTPSTASLLNKPLVHSFHEQPTELVKHRDPIAGGAFGKNEKKRTSKQPRLAKNFDGTDLEYDVALTYDSDDENYARSKAREKASY